MPDAVAPTRSLSLDDWARSHRPPDDLARGRLGGRVAGGDGRGLVEMVAGLTAAAETLRPGPRGGPGRPGPGRGAAPGAADPGLRRRGGAPAVRAGAGPAPGQRRRAGAPGAEQAVGAPGGRGDPARRAGRLCRRGGRAGDGAGGARSQDRPGGRRRPRCSWRRRRPGARRGRSGSTWPDEPAGSEFTRDGGGGGRKAAGVEEAERQAMRLLEQPLE